LAYGALWLAVGALVSSYPFFAVNHPLPRLYYLIAGCALGATGIASLISEQLRRYLQRQYHGAAQVTDVGANGTEPTPNESPLARSADGHAPLWERRTAVLVALFAVFLLLAFSWVWRWTRNVILAENASGLTVQVVRVSVCGRNYSMEELPTGGEREIFFTVTCDSGFDVAVSLADGTRHRASFGYVTGGAGAHGNRVRVHITKDGISGEQHF